jgi:beta-lactamase regulating signal transducer with metallopeptidase domain
MSPLEMFSHPVWQRLTWTLLHFVWQGFAVAAVLAVVLYACRARQARIRYAMSLAAMLVMAACAVVTFLLVEFEAPQVATDHAIVSEIAAAPIHFSLGGQFASEIPAAESMWELSSLTRAMQPYVMAGWLAGVLILSTRLLFSLLSVQWLKRGRRPLPETLADRFERLGRRLGLSTATRMFLSDRVGEAIVVGFWRPLVLLPAAWVTEMPADVLEAIVAHELAHIRRWDLWVNLFQRIMETLLFYHPAVWWLSQRIRLEREMCCDELAVAVTGQRVVYVQALELVARRRLVSPRPVLVAAIGGGTKMNLLSRVRNVLGLAPGKENARWWPVGLVMLSVPVILWVASVGFIPPSQSKATADDERPRAEQPREGERREAAEREGAAREGERRDADRPREGERREGDRPVVREGERPRADGDRPRVEGERPREGDRPAVREGGDRPAVREGERREGGDRPVVREGDRPRVEGDRPRVEGERPAADGRDLTPREAELMRVISQLQQEVASLRRQLQARGGEGDRPAVRDGERREGDRPAARDGDRREEGEGRKPAAEGERKDESKRRIIVEEGDKEGR